LTGKWLLMVDKVVGYQFIDESEVSAHKNL
jgi:hypothetical protein